MSDGTRQKVSKNFSDNYSRTKQIRQPETPPPPPPPPPSDVKKM